jgi:hypothetical protein
MFVMMDLYVIETRCSSDTVVVKCICLKKLLLLMKIINYRYNIKRCNQLHNFIGRKSLVMTFGLSVMKSSIVYKHEFQEVFSWGKGVKLWLKCSFISCKI